MKTIEHKNVIDKANWERGEWDSEPDKAQWPDEVTGYPCLIVRHSSGHLCGYVGVTKDHPFFEKGYDECDLSGEDEYLDVHGGLTFADHCTKGRKQNESVCHKVEQGEDDKVWWLGFDCAHSGDYSRMSYAESHRGLYPHTGDIYRNISYVRNQCKSLARQLKGHN